MSKNKAIFFILIFTIVLILIFSFSSENKEQNIKKDIIYEERMSFIEKNNGWFFYMYENNYNEIFFDGCNLKYKDLAGYYVNIYTDKSETKIYDKIPTFPTLSTSDYKKDKILERDEVVEIDDFFNKKQFRTKINEKDLEELKLENFEKKDILALFNDLQEKDFSPDLTKYKLSECKILDDNFDSGYKLNVGILSERKGFSVVRIDVIYDNNKYLSDLVNKNIATDEQRKLYNNMKKIENYIVSNQEIDIQEKFDFNEEIYLRLYSLLRKVEKWKD